MKNQLTSDEIPRLSTVSKSKETVEENGDMIDKIRKYIHDHQIQKNLMWSNPEFLDFYYAEKLKTAILLQQVLLEFEIYHDVKEKTSDQLKKTDKNYVAKATEEIHSEEERLNKIFEETQNLPTKIRSQKIINHLHLEDIFTGTEPYICRIKNVLIAVLDEQAYKKVRGDHSCGVFLTQELPIAIIKAVHDYDDFNSRLIYSEIIGETVRKIINAEFDEYQIQEVLDFGGIPLNEDPDDEDYSEKILDTVYEMMPFEAWYATNMLEIESGNNGMFFETAFDVSQSYHSNEAIELQLEAKETVRHEFHHSVCRFLPVHQPSSLSDQEKENRLNDWLSSFAEEIIVFSYSGQLADAESYGETYDSENTYTDTEEEAFIKEGFVEGASFLQEVNERIIQSSNPKLVSTFFSTEKVSNWKHVHEYLMKNKLPELGYFTGEIHSENLD